MLRPLPLSTLFPYTTLFRSRGSPDVGEDHEGALRRDEREEPDASLPHADRRRHAAGAAAARQRRARHRARSEEHTSELQSLRHLVCRLLLEKKKKTPIGNYY